MKELPPTVHRFVASDHAPAPRPPTVDLSSVAVHGRGWRAVIPTALVCSLLSGAIGFAARPSADVARLEAKIDRLDAKLGVLSDAVAAKTDALDRRQRDDSNAQGNAIRDLGLQAREIDRRLSEFERRARP